MTKALKTTYLDLLNIQEYAQDTARKLGEDLSSWPAHDPVEIDPELTQAVIDTRWALETLSRTILQYVPHDALVEHSRERVARKRAERRSLLGPQPPTLPRWEVVLVDSQGDQICSYGTFGSLTEAKAAMEKKGPPNTKYWGSGVSYKYIGSR